jgi:Glycosyltransferase (GlcNAc)
MDNRIFISMASYMDPMLFFTLQDAVSHARRPELLHFAVVDQNSENQRDKIDALPFAKQIRYCHVHPQDTLGVSWARSLVFSLYDGEEYLLQVDSHTHFEDGWDDNLHEQYRGLLLLSPKPILSTYPYPFTIEDGQPTYNRPKENHTVLVLRPHPETPLDADTTVLRFQAKHLFTDKPVLGCHVAAGFLFCSGSFVEEVPYDPYLYFHGEEQSLSIRAYTRGWDIYHPTWIPLYHLYKQANTPHETHHWYGDIASKRAFDMVALQDRAKMRLQRLLKGDGLPGAFGIGNVRTLEDFAVMSGIDYKNSVITNPYEGLLH